MLRLLGRLGSWVLERGGVCQVSFHGVFSTNGMVRISTSGFLFFILYVVGIEIKLVSGLRSWVVY